MLHIFILYYNSCCRTPRSFNFYFTAPAIYFALAQTNSKPGPDVHLKNAYVRVSAFDTSAISEIQYMYPRTLQHAYNTLQPPHAYNTYLSVTFRTLQPRHAYNTYLSVTFRGWILKRLAFHMPEKRFTIFKPVRCSMRLVNSFLH